MHSEKSVSEAYSLVRLALPLMSKYHIPATPRNYTVWYHYVSGTNSELSKTIDALRERGEEFTEEKNEILYCQYFSQKDENELKNIRQELEHILTTVLREVTDLTGQTEEYQSFLSNTVPILVKDASVQQLKEVMGEILDKTKTLSDFGKTLRRKLAETNETLETLKTEFEQVKAQALMDFLTAVPNRKAFHEALIALTGEAVSEGKDLSLLLMDIDHFKRFNDEHGHLMGDEVLRFVAKKIKEVVRGRDFLSRFGGEEFALILPETPLAGAAVVAESIRAFFATTTLKDAGTARKLGKITLSVGAACYRPGEDPEEFVKRADQALYAAKKRGRNCVIKESDILSKQKQGGRSPGKPRYGATTP